MTAPPGLMGMALALWGVSTGQLALGVVLGILLEAMRLSRGRESAVTLRRLVWLVRLVAVAVLGKLVYDLVAGQMPQSLYAWLRWLPPLLLPIPAAQLLAGGTLPLGPFVDAFRGRAVEARAIDATHAFAAVTLVAAATGNLIEPVFYAAAAILVAWALVARVARKRWAITVALMVAGCALGHGIHRGLASLQTDMEEMGAEFLADYFSPKPDPFRERTRIGDLGRVKLTDRVLMRVVPAGSPPRELLLREASFDRYDNGEWRNTQRAFRLLHGQGDRWMLRAGDGPQQMTIRRSIPGGEGLLALPVGAQVVERLPARSLEVLPFGTVRAKGTPRFVALDVRYDERLADDAPPGRQDLDTPELFASLLDQVLAREGLKGASGDETLRAVQRFFASRFAYSLTTGDTKSGARGIAEFLLRDRKGHCEYFATATVLLLRRAGIPARYTVGYSAQEYSDREQAFLVRHRHGHAWARAYVDGRWVTVDTTPSRWAESEREAARGALGPLMDWVSWVADRAVQSWISHSARQFALAAAMGFALLAAPFAIRLLLRRLRAGSRTKRAPASPAALAWRSLEKRLAKRGLGPRPGETALAWARRLQAESASEPWRAKLIELARAYYRLRFDPTAPAHSEREFMDAVKGVSFRRSAPAPGGSRFRSRGT